MKVIYKYPLEVCACTIDLPVFSKIVCVHEQNYTPTLWIEQDPNAAKEAITFFVCGTGESIPGNSNHVGTCFIGSYVWHVYQKNHD